MNKTLHPQVCITGLKADFHSGTLVQIDFVLQAGFPFSHSAGITDLSTMCTGLGGFYMLRTFSSLLALQYVRLLRDIIQRQIIGSIRDGTPPTSRGSYCVGDCALSMSFHYINFTFILPKTQLNHSPSEHGIFPEWSILSTA